MVSRKIVLAGDDFDIEHGRGTRKILDEHLGERAAPALVSLAFALAHGTPVQDPAHRDILHLHGLVHEDGTVRNPVQALAATMDPSTPTTNPTGR